MLLQSIDPALVESFQMQEPEERSHGAVGWKIFSAYFQALGNCLYVSFVFMTVILSQLFASAGDWWITVWYVCNQNLVQLKRTVAFIHLMGKEYFKSNFAHVLSV